MDRPILAWTLTHQRNTIRLFCLRFASHKKQPTPIVAPLRLKDPFANLCKRHGKGEIYRATSLSELITDVCSQIHLETEFQRCSFDWLTINKQKKGTPYLEIGQRLQTPRSPEHYCITQCYQQGRRIYDETLS